MVTKRGQAAGAAVLLAIIMGLIIFFIILMPPEKRAELLGEKNPSAVPTEKGGVPAQKVAKEVLLQETPGHMAYLKEKEIEKLIPATHIFTKTESEILSERDYLDVKSATFSSQTEEMYFEIKDLAHTQNILLDLVIEKYQGELSISLNGKEIFNKETNKFKPLKLPSSLLTEKNTLTFKVSSPGIAFWRTNQYDLKNIKVVADITDISAQQSKNLFYIGPSESKNIEGATLRFSLSCLPEEMGKIEVKINDYPVFSGMPENCEDIFYYDLPPEIIKEGNNWVSFKIDEGDYEINQIAIKTKLTAPSYPVYYFELDDTYFTEKTGQEAECGKIDGICPDNCNEDLDKDCCFQEYSTPFWCDDRTKNSNDRCVGHVDPVDCQRCPSGYEDKDSNPPSECEKLCGDDTDNYCPPGCNLNYDKDCCFEKSGEQFWCDDLPLTGIDFTCVNSVSRDECSSCPSTNSYEGEETSPECPEEKEKDMEEKLKDDYDVILTLEFVTEENKEAEIYLNGHKISFDTDKVEFSRNIDNYVEPWTNSIKIIPKNSFDIKQLTVELKG